MTTPMRSGIPTTYRGTNFRSRLEARWAAFFDLIGWSWTYEPIDADGYIPDFLIHGEQPFFVEVGPCVTAMDYTEKGAKADARAAILGHDLVVVGVSPIAPVGSCWADALTIGYLGEFFPGHSTDDCTDTRCDHAAAFAWGAGVWSDCWQNDPPNLYLQFAMFHDTLSYAHRPCGCHSDDPRTVRNHRAEVIEGIWADAGNAVQWKKAA